MVWTEKKRPSSFDTQPIDGLFFVDGDYQQRTRHTPWAENRKRPTIVFPSGARCDLSGHSDAEKARVHIFGALDVPLIDANPNIFSDAQGVAREHWFLIEPIDDNSFIVTGEAESAVIAYDALSHRLNNVIFLRDGVAVLYAVSDIWDDKARELLPKQVPPEPLALRTVAPVRYMLSDTDWAWYATAFDGVDTFYGLVVENDIWCATFSLADLARLRGPLGYPVEHDYDFWPTALGELKIQHERLRGEQMLLNAFPTNWVAKADLLSIRPDLTDQIQALDDNDLAEIADKLGDALSESY